MTAFKLFRTVVLAACLSASLAACGDDDDDGGTPNTDAAVAPDAPTSFTCDPVGSNAEVGDLLNAPLESDVEVITKTPQHPGDPGPDNLP